MMYEYYKEWYEDWEEWLVHTNLQRHYHHAKGEEHAYALYDE